MIRLFRDWEKLSLIGGIIYRKSEKGFHVVQQLVLMDILGLRFLHDDLRYPGTDRATKTQFPGHMRDIEN